MILFRLHYINQLKRFNKSISNIERKDLSKTCLQRGRCFADSTNCQMYVIRVHVNPYSNALILIVEIKKYVC